MLQEKRDLYDSDILCYIDEMISLFYPNFKDHLHLIYQNVLEIKETTDTPSSASYLDLNMYIDDFMTNAMIFTFDLQTCPFLVAIYRYF